MGVFEEFDTNKDGTISQAELTALFQKINGFNKWTEEDYEVLFRASDFNDDGVLSYLEFVDWLLGLQIPQIYQRGTKTIPVHRTREIAYPSGVTVKVSEVQKVMSQHGYFKQLKQERPPGIGSGVRAFLYDRSYNRTLHRIFVEADENSNELLHWNNTEIYVFCIRVFEHLDLPRPAGGDPLFHKIYQMFDEDESWSLNERECLCMTDAILRGIAKATRGADDSSDDD